MKTRGLALTVILVVSTFEAPWGAAQEPMLEEIIVTAQRKEQRLRDVPISIEAFDSEFMRREGFTDLQDLSHFVPNIRIDVSGNQVLPRLRGFGTNTTVTRGQEQPVGLVIDEVPYGRSDYFPAGLLDVDRVEVLRGPQGQLFGANTTIGLINLTTKNPTEEYEGFINLERGELSRQRVEAALGGALLPGLVNFRIAGVTDKREGHVNNTTAMAVPGADKRLGGRDRWAFRAKLDFPNLFGGSLLLSFQRDHLDMGGTPAEITIFPERFLPFIRQFDPDVDIGPLNYIGSVDLPTFLKGDIHTVVVNGHYALESWDLNTVLGWSKLESLGQSDADFGPYPLANVLVDEASRQATVEFRVTSPDLPGFLGIGNLFGLSLGSSDFTTGLFFQKRTLKPATAETEINGPLILALTAFDSTPGGTVLPFPGVGIPSQAQEMEYLISGFEQESERLAGYGQINWYIDDQWTLFFGARLDETTKEAYWNQRFGPETAVLFPLSSDEFTDQDNRTEFNVAPKVGVKFDWTDDINSYLTWSRNYQPAGFNNFNASENREDRRFKAARVQSWEAGAKMRLFDGALQLDLGLFWMNMEEFQLFTVTPEGIANLPFNQIVNVGELRARGVEASATWVPADWVRLRGALGYNDNEYLDFPVGPCMADRENTDGDNDPRCDLTGQQLEQAPKWDVGMLASFRVPLLSIPWVGEFLPASLEGVDITSGLHVQYVDERFLHETNDPRMTQPSFSRVDANIGIENANQGWSLQIRVENVTDETTANLARGASAGPSGVIVKMPETPRLVVGQFRWGF